MFFFFFLPLGIILVDFAELLRENKRMLDKSIREIERERQGLQTQEKKLINEIKKVAKQGQMVRAKIKCPRLFPCLARSIFSIASLCEYRVYKRAFVDNSNFTA